jgi:hypothetical protein
MNVTDPPWELSPSRWMQNMNVVVAQDELYVPSDNGTYSVHPDATPSSLHETLNVSSMLTINSHSEAILIRGVAKSKPEYV